jgi:hypothetical protein
MDRTDVQERLNKALKKLAQNDRHLLENDLSERCIASRLAMYLQQEFPDHSVDVEYNRHGDIPKKLGLSEECANRWDRNGKAFVVPDVIVHRRGPSGPNILVLELKKTTNRIPRDCDRLRVSAFRKQLGYTFSSLIECETRKGHEPEIAISEWLEDE